MFTHKDIPKLKPNRSGRTEYKACRKMIKEIPVQIGEYVWKISCNVIREFEINSGIELNVCTVSAADRGEIESVYDARSNISSINIIYYVSIYGCYP